jgi:hypothetical protein
MRILLGILTSFKSPIPAFTTHHTFVDTLRVGHCHGGTTTNCPRKLQVRGGHAEPKNREILKQQSSTYMFFECVFSKFCQYWQVASYGTLYFSACLASTATHCNHLPILSPSSPPFLFNNALVSIQLQMDNQTQL